MGPRVEISKIFYWRAKRPFLPVAIFELNSLGSHCKGYQLMTKTDALKSSEPEWNDRFYASLTHYWDLA